MPPCGSKAFMRFHPVGAKTMCEFDFDRKGDNMSNMIQAARQQVAQLTQAAYEKAAQAGVLPAGVEVNATIQIPKDTAHGDYATSFAMAGAKAMHMAPRAIAQAMGEKYGVPFVYRDFRPLFQSGQEFAREHGMYMQKYCGCIFSEEDRYMAAKRKKKAARAALEGQK